MDDTFEAVGKEAGRKLGARVPFARQTYMEFQNRKLPRKMKYSFGRSRQV